MAKLPELAKEYLDNCRTIESAKESLKWATSRIAIAERNLDTLRKELLKSVDPDGNWPRRRIFYFDNDNKALVVEYVEGRGVEITVETVER